MRVCVCVCVCVCALTSLLLPHLIIPHRLTAFLESLMPLKN